MLGKYPIRMTFDLPSPAKALLVPRPKPGIEVRITVIITAAAMPNFMPLFTTARGSHHPE
jgi:hypothetical protein